MEYSWSCWIISLLITIGGIDGRRPREIIGPTETVCSNERKYQVSLWKGGKIQGINSIQYLGGGAIIDENHILTAAHLFGDSKSSVIMIRAGCHKMEDSPREEFRMANGIFMHPKFGRSTSDKTLLINDIAIVVLNSPLILSGSISAIELPNADVRAGQMGELAGWGGTGPKENARPSRVLLKTAQKILPDEYCSSRRAEVLFCAIDEERKTVPFKGDSGSPFVINDTIVGVLSFVSARDSHGPWNISNYDATFYSRVFRYLDFINHVRSISNGPTDPDTRWPYLVSIWIDTDPKCLTSFICSGIILSRNHILTAAHCVAKSQFRKISIKVGFARRWIGGGTKRLVEKIRVHPEYADLGDGQFVHDIAILSLENSLPCDESISSINLPAFDVTIGLVGEVSRTRWKYRSLPSRTTMIVLRKESCLTPPIAGNTQFCANDAARGQILDHLDSGSPFVYNNTVVGIISYIHQRTDSHTFYTNIFPYVDFIKNIMELQIIPLSSGQMEEQNGYAEYSTM